MTTHRCRLRRHLAATALACLGAATLAVPAASAKAVSPTADALFVATAGGGTLVPLAGQKGAYRLTLRAPASFVTAFADHPARSANRESLRRFVAQWAARGFRADPPNAALVLDRAPAAHDTFIFALSQPRITRSGALRFRAQRIGSRPGGRLAAIAAGADRGAPARFGRSALFVDDGSTALGITITASGVPAGQVAGVDFDESLILDETATTHTQVEGTSAFEAFFGSSQVSMFGLEGKALASGTAMLALDHASGPVPGFADVPAGATVTLRIGAGPAVPLSDGQFSVPAS